MDKLKLMISDWDGVFTSVKYHDQEATVGLKTYKDIDMTAIKCFWTVGVPFVVLSGDPWNAKICQSRGIPFYDSRNSLGLLDKRKIIEDISNEYKIDKRYIGYVGDDIFDIDSLNYSFFSFCPKDASIRVIREIDNKYKGYSRILERNGGQGCIDEIFWDLYSKNYFENAFDYERLVQLDKKQMKV